MALLPVNGKFDGLAVIVLILKGGRWACEAQFADAAPVDIWRSRAKFDFTPGRSGFFPGFAVISVYERRGSRRLSVGSTTTSGLFSFVFQTECHHSVATLSRRRYCAPVETRRGIQYFASLTPVFLCMLLRFFFSVVSVFNQMSHIA